MAGKVVKVDRKAIRLQAAKLYGRGFTRVRIARALSLHLSPRSAPEKRHKHALRVLARWEMQESFRDLVWKHAVVKLDLETPAILHGISKKARQGRVDAARLSLEVTGRHVPKGDSHPTQILLQMGNIPRPEAIDLQAEEVETAELESSEAAA